ncbi:hypothetical protein ACEQ6C_38440, partial [Rhizobium ruizarguesonis]
MAFSSFIIKSGSSAIAVRTSFIKLENAIRKAGMQNLSEIGPRFDYTEASRHIAWFWSDFVPRFNQAEPPGVSNTHYRVNLATVEQVNDDELRKWLNTW